MNSEWVEQVYYTLCGELLECSQVPGVENAFEEGKPCDLWYSELIDTCHKIRELLGDVNCDSEIDKILHCQLSIQQELCKKMYEYGALFANKNPTA